MVIEMCCFCYEKLPCFCRKENPVTYSYYPRHSQPPPKHNASTPIVELVIADLQARAEKGQAKYGTKLQAGNGRDGLVDLYEELADALLYCRQEIEDKKALKARLEHMESELIELGEREE